MQKMKKSMIPYLFWAFMTTLLNYAVFGLFYYSPLHISGPASNVIAYIAGTSASFLANKKYVFRSHDWSRKTVIREALKFLSVRVSTFLIEEGGLIIADILQADRFVLIRVGSIRLDGILLSKMGLSLAGMFINYALCNTAVFQAKNGGKTNV